ncbi:helix-turn-helix domain-containing protein [Halovenus sp. WSH3]|uniref:Helix-turn-helix domain-containing protein n=1 Tax=Halovenus carboxidivorans TaxID=2692199 RepID=A0A6B0TCD8_9EURY|nr:PadR family transcriptional regulator [Halovenus carboxidivorans]MXR50869.1 helix-turn-helix domain-containing protein [Halovenus carboxidivorans]
MTQFLQSGRRRDICALLAGESMQAQALKSRLESTYDTRIDPQSFYGALDALEDQGFVETRTEGIHDVYELTDAGAARLNEHVDWLLSETGRA